MKRVMQAPSVCRWIAGWLLVLGVALPGAAQNAAQSAPLDTEAAEQLVRQAYFEGLPQEQAARIDAAGAAHLVTLLQDASESEYHANILVALSAAGHAGAYEAIAAWALLPRSGEVDRGSFRAWQALPHALGTLARHDRRAVPLLVRQLDAEAPGWRFRHHSGERIAQLTRRGAALGLAMSGAPEADGALRNVEARSHADPSFRAHLREARARLRAQNPGQSR